MAGAAGTGATDAAETGATGAAAIAGAGATGAGAVAGIAGTDAAPAGTGAAGVAVPPGAAGAAPPGAAGDIPPTTVCPLKRSKISASTTALSCPYLAADSCLIARPSSAFALPKGAEFFMLKGCDGSPPIINRIAAL